MRYPKREDFVGQPGDPNPVTGIVVAEQPSPQYKNACRLTIEIAPGVRRILDVWGEMLEPFQKFSEESALWLGLRVSVLTEEAIGGKRKRRITVG